MSVLAVHQKTPGRDDRTIPWTEVKNYLAKTASEPSNSNQGGGLQGGAVQPSMENPSGETIFIRPTFRGMQSHPHPVSLEAKLASDLPIFRLPNRLIVVADLMESVRLMQSDEQTTLTRWLDFTRFLQAELLPAHQAQLVKSLGDGVLLQLGDALQLELLTRRMHAHFAQLNTGLPESEQMWLRIGCHVADVFAADQDIYGAGVNLTSRIASLAGPGETVVSVEVRDQLVVGLHADLPQTEEWYFNSADAFS